MTDTEPENTPAPESGTDAGHAPEAPDAPALALALALAPAETRFGWEDWTVIGAAALLAVGLFNIRPPVQHDDWYHLAVMRAFSERGPSLHAWWQFAPPGRPHLYPPLLHLLGALIMRCTPLTVAGVNTLYRGLTYPSGLVLLWMGVRLLHGRRAAFWCAVLLGTELSMLYPGGVMILPSSWVLISVPLLLWCVLRRRWIAATAIFTAGLYTHMGIPMVVLVALLVTAWRLPETRRTVGRVLLASLVLYAPWLVHVLANVRALQSAHTPVGFQMPVLLWAIGLAGWVAVHRSPERLGRVWSFLAIGLLVFLPRYAHRFWPYMCIPLAAMGGIWLANRKGRLSVVLKVLAAASCLLGTLYVQSRRSVLRQYMGGKGPVEFRLAGPATVARYLGQGKDAFAETGAVAWVRANTRPDDIVVVEKPYLGDKIFALTGRRTTTGGWREVNPPGMRAKIREFVESGGGVELPARTETRRN
ncbi:MAG: hypothetical protein ACYTGB_14590 [Planctomycetota bacterium]